MATVISRPHELPKPRIVFRDGGWRMEVLDDCGGKAMLPQPLWPRYFELWNAKKTLAHIRKLNREEP